MQNFIALCGEFWKKNPALLYGLSVLLGFYAAIDLHWILLLPLATIWGPLCSFNLNRLFRKRLILALILGAAAFASINHHYCFPTIPHKGIEGTGFFNIQSITEKNSYSKTAFLYTGRLKCFKSNHQLIAKNIPCTIFIKGNYFRPPGDSSYIIEGRLLKSDHGSYFLKINSQKPWNKIKKSWSIAEYQFQAKAHLKELIHQKIHDKQTADFLTGICTGQLTNNQLKFELGRLGLQHIIAISGFHFALIAGIFGFALRLFLSQKKAAIVLMALMSTYFVFIGWSPSVERAWIAIMIFFGGSLFERQSFSLNSLGVALIIVCLTDPLNMKQIGFIFSFLTTASILLFFQGADLILQKMLKKRALSVVLGMNRANQHAYLVLCFFRKALALTIAVHLTAIPATLYFFHKFPLLGLVYNLFFPFLVTFSMILLILGLLTHLLFPFLGNIFFSLAEHYTHFILKITTGSPKILNIAIQTKTFTLEILISYLCVLLITGIILHSYLQNKRNQSNDRLLI